MINISFSLANKIASLQVRCFKPKNKALNAKYNINGNQKMISDETMYYSIEQQEDCKVTMQGKALTHLGDLY